MFFLLALVAIVVIYVSTFKENFTQEKIDKVAPILVVGALIIAVLTIINAVL